MEYRELLRQQELAAQRREHGPAADASERSLRLYPGNALREVVSASAHPLNLEPLLLTLARDGNADLRLRFGEAAGEVVLITKALGYAAVVGDLQVISGRRVVDARDGFAYPAVVKKSAKATDATATATVTSKKDGSKSEKEEEAAATENDADDHGSGFLPAPLPVSYEVWTRVEALAALTAMLRERSPRALLLAPPMQLRLLEELAGLAAGAEGADAEAEAAAALAAADAEAEAAAAEEAKAREEEKKVKEEEMAKGKKGDDKKDAEEQLDPKQQEEQAELKRAADKARRKERAAVAVAARRHPLLRLHALLALVEALKLFHAARPDAVHLHVDAAVKAEGGDEGTAAAGFDLLLVRAAMGLLEAAATAEDDDEGEGAVATDDPNKPPVSLAASARQLFRGDPVQRAKALAAGCELLYLLASTAAPGIGGTGNYVPSNAAAGGGGGEEQEGPKAASDTRSCVRLMEGPPPASSPLGAPALAARGAAPVLARALEAAAKLLKQRREFSVAAASGGDDSATSPFTEEQVAMGDVPFGVNWRHYLQGALPSKACAQEARAALELGGALLQAVALSAAAAGDKKASEKQQLWPSEASLRSLAAYEGGDDDDEAEARLAESAAAVGALLLASAGYDESSAGAAPQRLHVAARAAHRALADARLGKRCAACGKQEGVGGGGGGGEEVAPLKKCSACHRDWYCGPACQRAAWKSLGHKELCAQVGGGALRRQRAEGMMMRAEGAGEEEAAAAAAVKAVAIEE
jgi:hypothetical protein